MAFDSDTEADLTLAIAAAAAATDPVLHQTINSTLFEYTTQLMQSYCMCVKTILNSTVKMASNKRGRRRS